METYFGLIKTPHDALLIFEACHLGIISRVHRRLSDIERQCVRSGSVYCFDEREAGMRRWTDGKSWSPSRVTGSFLTYRELDDSQTQAGNGAKNVYRPNGLLKQSFSITTSDNKKLHLISYYTTEDVASERLFETPSQDPRFANILIPSGIYPETSP
ncbi:Gti1/Pac2 family-domain-containing protein, partial [Lobosporangium transversale]